MPDTASSSRSERAYPKRPIVGVGAVVLREGQRALARHEVLIVRRGSPPGYGEWSIPGGAVELGETLRDAALREVMEECGVEIDITDVVDVLDRVALDVDGMVEYHFVLVDFAARYRTGELQAGSDILEAKWVPVDELPRIGLRQQTLAVIRKALAELGVLLNKER